MSPNNATAPGNNVTNRTRILLLAIGAMCVCILVLFAWIFWKYKIEKEKAKNKEIIMRNVIERGRKSTVEIELYPGGVFNVLTVPGSPSVVSGDWQIDTNVLPQGKPDYEHGKSFLDAIEGEEGKVAIVDDNVDDNDNDCHGIVRVSEGKLPHPRAMQISAVDGEETADVNNIHIENSVKTPQYDEYPTARNQCNETRNINSNIAQDEFVS